MPFLMAVKLLVVSMSGQAQVMLGAYLPSDGWSRAPIAEWRQQLGHKAPFINIFSSFSHNWSRHLSHQVSNLHAEGAVPMISWMPIDRRRPKVNILQEVADGQWDAYLTEWIQGAQQWLQYQVASYDSANPPTEREPRLMIRFAHEFNGNWYAYSNQPQTYIKAWQYLYDRFNSYRVNGRLLNDYIEWIWCPNNFNFDDVQDFTQYYPGDAFVDWTGIDGYNWGSNFSWSEWKSFAEVFELAYQTLENDFPTKPIMIAEVGSTNPEDIPNAVKGQAGTNRDAAHDKDQWFEQMAQQLPQRFPLIKAISIFNTNKELGWALYGKTSQGASNRGLKGIKAAIKNHPNVFSFEYVSIK